MHPFDELLIISLDPNCFSDWDIKDSWCTFVQEIGNSGNLCYLLATHPKHSQQIALSLPITVTKCYPRWLNWSPHFSFLQKCYRSTNDPSAITIFSNDTHYAPLCMLTLGEICGLLRPICFWFWFWRRYAQLKKMLKYYLTTQAKGPFLANLFELSKQKQ